MLLPYDYATQGHAFANSQVSRRRFREGLNALIEPLWSLNKRVKALIEQVSPRRFRSLKALLSLSLMLY